VAQNASKYFIRIRKKMQICVVFFQGIGEENIWI